MKKMSCISHDRVFLHFDLSKKYICYFHLKNFNDKTNQFSASQATLVPLIYHFVFLFHAFLFASSTAKAAVAESELTTNI